MIANFPNSKDLRFFEEIFFQFQVTADIHVYHASSFQLINITFFLANMVKAILVSCGYWLTFIFIELIKFSLLLFISFANVSSILQVAVTFDLRFVKKTRLKVLKVTKSNELDDRHDD